MGIYIHIWLIHFVVQQKLTALLSNYTPIKMYLKKRRECLCWQAIWRQQNDAGMIKRKRL